MHPCAVKSCIRNTKNLQMHRLPRENERLKIWLQLLGRLDILDICLFKIQTKKQIHYFVCDEHFSEKQKLSVFIRNRSSLLRDAVPDKNLKIAPLTPKLPTYLFQSVEVLADCSVPSTSAALLSTSAEPPSTSAALPCSNTSAAPRSTSAALPCSSTLAALPSTSTAPQSTSTAIPSTSIAIPSTSVALPSTPVCAKSIKRRNLKRLSGFNDELFKYVKTLKARLNRVSRDCSKAKAEVRKLKKLLRDRNI